MTDSRKALGEAVRRRRKDLGLTQEELAERSGLHWTYISGIERGVRNVSIVKLITIASALGVRLSVLVEDL